MCILIPSHPYNVKSAYLCNNIFIEGIKGVIAVDIVHLLYD